MKAMQAGIHEEGLVLHIPTKTVCAEPFPFLQLNLYSTSVKDLSFKKAWKISLKEDIDALDGFVVWFDTFFLTSCDDVVPGNERAEKWSQTYGKGVAFTTGPHGKETHWRQGVLLIDNTNEKAAPRKRGDVLSGFLEYAVPEENSRALDISVTWTIEPDEKSQSQLWRMK